ncbi:curli assembly protein CsgC [Alsobacter metallidurans]|uniref:Curli assembly protein CsgC n=1 Tax=Alsobacter metallidurans TaxID=340221 RepID=A0A917IB28_9HYPH|nr:HlyD family efflux transporter periplasmic adaptor subunit [Alsobacter metallidurans]GGH31004.1 curli assembly protein CsgC [Alsobacter metallidurans]
MRVFSFSLGLVLAAAGGYLTVGEHLAGKSADAALNARLTTIRAPLDGMLQLKVRAVGSRVAEGETLIEIQDGRFDATRLADLERDRLATAAEIDRNASQRQTTDNAKAGLLEQARLYREGRIRQLEAKVAEARAIGDAAAARQREADATLKRGNDLNDRGVQTASALDRARAASDVALQEIESARQRRTYLEAELASARNGVFIGDSYNDEPFSVQRLRELDFKTAELAAERLRLDTRLRQADEAVAAERVRVNRLSQARMNASGAGVTWDYLVADGEHVRRGQDLVRLVDCSTIVVTASVTESLYNTLQIGAPARFRLFNDGRVFNASVVRLAGAGAAGLYGNMAVAPSAEHLRHYDVTLLAPTLARDPELGCAVGRTGHVIFSDGPIEEVRSFLAGLGI